MTILDSLLFYMVAALNWIGPVVLLIGLVMCVGTYWKCRKRGYLLISIFFFLAAISHFMGASISQVLWSRFNAQPQLSPEAQNQYAQELTDLYLKYYPKGQTATLDINIPVGPILLVCGLWGLSRREERRITEPDSREEPPPSTSIGSDTR